MMQQIIRLMDGGTVVVRPPMEAAAQDDGTLLVTRPPKGKEKGTQVVETFAHGEWSSVTAPHEDARPTRVLGGE